MLLLHKEKIPVLLKLRDPSCNRLLKKNCLLRQTRFLLRSCMSVYTSSAKKLRLPCILHFLNSLCSDAKIGIFSK